MESYCGRRWSLKSVVLACVVVAVIELISLNALLSSPIRSGECPDIEEETSGRSSRVVECPLCVCAATPGPAPPSPPPANATSTLANTTLANATLDDFDGETCHNKDGKPFSVDAWIELCRRIWDANDTTVPKRFIVTGSGGAIGNREVSFLNGVLLGILTNRAVIIHGWDEPGEPFGEFNDLFDPPIPFRMTPNTVRGLHDIANVERIFGRGQVKEFQMTVGGQMRPMLDCPELYKILMCGDPTHDFFNDKKAILLNVHCWTWSHLVYTNPCLRGRLIAGLGWHPWHAISSRILVPKKPIVDAVDTFWNTSGMADHRTIGIHIRHGRGASDLYFSDSVDDTFRTALSCIQRANRTHFADTPKRRTLLYVATDNAQILQKLRDTFGSDVIALEMSRTPDGSSIPALMDQLVLSRADVVIGTRQSTFSYPAFYRPSRPGWLIAGVGVRCAQQTASEGLWDNNFLGLQGEGTLNGINWDNLNEIGEGCLQPADYWLAYGRFGQVMALQA